MAGVWGQGTGVLPAAVQTPSLDPEPPGEGRWCALGEALGGSQNGFASALSEELTAQLFPPLQKGTDTGPILGWRPGRYSRAPGHIAASVSHHGPSL